MRLVRLFDLAESVFGSKEGVASWFQEKTLRLGLKTPLEYSSMKLGGREVEELLYRIENSLLS